MFLLVLSRGSGPCKRIDVFGVARTLWQILFNSSLKVFLFSILILFEQFSQGSSRNSHVIFFFDFVDRLCVL